MSDLQHQRIDELCQELRLGALASLYGPIAQDAAKRKNASYADFLEEALRAERDARRVRSREMLSRTAGFPAIKTLDDYDFGFATGAPRGQILELAALGFVERTENVVLLGPSGTGKTHIAISLGYLAVLSTVVAFAVYLTLLGRIGADKAAYSTVLFPILALALSTVFEGYQWTLLALTGDGAIRGAGAELRLYGLDPDAAEARARARGDAVLAASADKPHGLRECFLVDPDGYVWVPGTAISD